MISLHPGGNPTGNRRGPGSSWIVRGLPRPEEGALVYLCRYKTSLCSVKRRFANMCEDPFATTPVFRLFAIEFKVLQQNFLFFAKPQPLGHEGALVFKHQGLEHARFKNDLGRVADCHA